MHVCTLGPTTPKRALIAKLIAFLKGFSYMRNPNLISVLRNFDYLGVKPPPPGKITPNNNPMTL